MTISLASDWLIAHIPEVTISLVAQPPYGAGDDYFLGGAVRWQVGRLCQRWPCAVCVFVLWGKDPCEGGREAGTVEAEWEGRHDVTR